MSPNEIILNELRDVKSMLITALGKEAEDQIREFSLTKTATLLHMGVETLKTKADNGLIQALTENVGGTKVYRFLLSDIKVYQNERRHEAQPVGGMTGKELFMHIKNNGVKK